MKRVNWYLQFFVSMWIASFAQSSYAQNNITSIDTAMDGSDECSGRDLRDFANLGLQTLAYNGGDSLNRIKLFQEQADKLAQGFYNMHKQNLYYYRRFLSYRGFGDSEKYAEESLKESRETYDGYLLALAESDFYREFQLRFVLSAKECRDLASAASGIRHILMVKSDLEQPALPKLEILNYAYNAHRLAVLTPEISNLSELSSLIHVRHLFVLEFNATNWTLGSMPELVSMVIDGKDLTLDQLRQQVTKEKFPTLFYLSIKPGRFLTTEQISQFISDNQWQPINKEQMKDLFTDFRKWSLGQYLTPMNPSIPKPSEIDEP